jgi:hypothetical protein
MRGGPCFGSFGKLGPALFYNFHHPVTWSVLLVLLPEYEDLTLCEEKMRGLRAQMSPFTSLKNWSRRLQVLEVERMDDASV